MSTHIHEFIDTVFNHLKTQVGANTLAGLSTGFVDFDAMTGGLQPGCLIVIAGRPSMGKTAFVHNITHASMKTRVKTLVFSTETSKEEFAKQLILSNASMDANRLRINRMREEDWDRVQIAVDELQDASLWIDDSIELTSATIAAKCRKAFREQGALGLLVVDSIQLVREFDKQDQCHDVPATAKNLKALATELDIPIIVLSSISRGPENRENHRPILSDCPIGDEADVIALMFRDEYYDPESTVRGEAEIIIARNKCGPTGTVLLKYDGATRNFRNYSERDYDVCDQSLQKN